MYSIPTRDKGAERANHFSQLKKYRRDRMFDVRRDEVRELEEKQQQEENELKAEQFLEKFSLLLEIGLLERTGWEKNRIGRYEQEGWRENYLRRMKGWIPIFEFTSVFGNRNDADLKPPAWLELVAKKLAKRDWPCQFMKEVFCDVGAGNTITGLLCVRDPRVIS